VIQPTSIPGGSAVYSQSLPGGFIAAGAYHIADGGSAAVGAFAGQFTVSPVQIQTDLSPGTVLDTTQPFTLTWTGGTAGDQVTVKLVNGTSSAGSYDYAYADASVGSLTFDPICIGTPVQAGGSGVYCGFSLPGINEVIVEVSPGPNDVTSLAAAGITEGIQISWTYRYIFGSINPGP